MIVIVEFDGKTESITLAGGQETWETLKNEITRVFGLQSFSLSFAGMTLDYTLPMSSQVPDGATLMAKRKKFFLHDIPAQASPEVLLQLCSQHETLLPEILEVDPELGEKLSSKDVKVVRMLMMQRSFKGHKSQWDKKKEEDAIFANPDTAENQAKIAEMLRVQEVNRLHDIAMEENPESFAQVYMLYVNLEVNNVPLKAFVDSGAQMTIMNEATAERCNVLRFLDKRYAGMASGVGTAKILGKIHMVQMKLGNSYFPVSVTILENSTMDVLFGLDTLKRYRCAIDLNKNVLRMGDGVSGAEEVPFLSENEIPQKEKLEEGQGMLGGSSGGGSGDKAEDGAPPAPADFSSAMNVAPPAAPAQAQDSSAKVSALVAMGFNQAEASQALQACGGDADAAAALLFASK